MASARDEEVTQILAELGRPLSLDDAEQASANAFLETFKQFAEALNNNEFVEARVERGSHPQVFSLLTCPKFRRDNVNYLLTFQITADSATLISEFGTEERRHVSPEDMWTFLTQFLKNSNFGATLDQYKEAVAEPVDGFLRVSEPDVPSREDAAVVVSSDQQRQLGSAKLNSPLKLSVETQLFPFTTPYQVDGKYAWLVSHGYHMAVERIEVAGAKLLVVGIAKGPTQSS